MSCYTVIHPDHHPPVYVLFLCHPPRPSPTSICPVPLSSTQTFTHQYMSCSSVIHPDHHPPVYVLFLCHPPRPSPTSICPVPLSSTQTFTHQYMSCSTVIHPDLHPPLYVLFRCHPPRPPWCRLPSYRQYRIYQTRPILGYDPQSSPWLSQHPRSSLLDSHRRHPPRLETAETKCFYTVK